MDNQFIQFVRDVNDSYTFTESKIDANNNIVVSLEGRSMLVPYSQIMTYYDAFRNSSLNYNEWVTRTVGYVTNLTQNWYNRWK